MLRNTDLLPFLLLRLSKHFLSNGNMFGGSGLAVLRMMATSFLNSSDVLSGRDGMAVSDWVIIVSVGVELGVMEKLKLSHNVLCDLIKCNVEVVHDMMWRNTW